MFKEALGLGALGAMAYYVLSPTASSTSVKPVTSSGSIKILQGPAAAHTSGPRLLSAIQIIVLHDTEGDLGRYPEAPNALQVANDFAHPLDPKYGSAQIVVDDQPIAYRCVPDDVIAWGAHGANAQGLHLEMCGWARWSRADWLSKKRLLEAASQIIAAWAKKYSIPPTFLDASALATTAPDGTVTPSGRRGITTHSECTKAFSAGKGHWDPGPGFPLEDFIAGVGKRIQ